MGASNSPLQENKLDDFIKLMNQGSLKNNNISINNLNIVFNDRHINIQNPNIPNNQPFNAQNPNILNNQPFNTQNPNILNNQPINTQNPSFFNVQQTPVNYQNELNESSIKYININSEFGQMSLQVNQDDLIIDIIQKYKTKLGKQNIESITFYTQENIFLQPNIQLKNTGLQNFSIINAKIEYKQNPPMNIASEQNSFQSNRQISREESLLTKKKIKENLKKGYITFIIFSSSLKPKTYISRPNDYFKLIEDDYKLSNPGKDIIFLYDGKRLTPDKTLKEQKIKHLCKIVAFENEFN